MSAHHPIGAVRTMSQPTVLRARAPRRDRSPDQTLSEHVVERLRSEIVTGRFPPGARLIERDLTKTLGTSRTPIREALRQLERDGLVISYSHRGYFVRQPVFEEAQQAYESRRVVESACSELAAARATEVELAAIRESLQVARRVLESGDRVRLLLCNNVFHHLIVKASHNVFLEKQWLMLWAFVDLLRGERWSHSDRPETGHVEHEQLFQAIAQRDAALARTLSEQHVDRAWKNIATLLTWNNNERSDAGGMTSDDVSELSR